MSKKIISVQFDDGEQERLAKLVKVTGWSQSEVLRELVKVATVLRPVMQAELRTED